MDQMVKSLAKMIDHSLLHPTMTDHELIEGCRLARRHEVAAVCIKPYFVLPAAKLLEGSGVLVCTVIGFPHGNSRIDVKVFETERALDDGAHEIDMVVNIGRVLSEDWGYIEDEVRAVFEACDARDGILKVIFENDFLPSDHFKIKLCEICSSIGVHFVKTSTGYGMVKGPDGKYDYRGATDEDLRLMRAHCPATVQVKAAGGVRTLDDLLRVRELGVTRVGATATEAILEDARRRFSGETALRQS